MLNEKKKKTCFVWGLFNCTSLKTKGHGPGLLLFFIVVGQVPRVVHFSCSFLEAYEPSPPRGIYVLVQPSIGPCLT